MHAVIILGQPNSPSRGPVKLHQRVVPKNPQIWPQKATFKRYFGPRKPLWDRVPTPWLTGLLKQPNILRTALLRNIPAVQGKDCSSVVISSVVKLALQGDDVLQYDSMPEAMTQCLSSDRAVPEENARACGTVSGISAMFDKFSCSCATESSWRGSSIFGLKKPLLGTTLWWSFTGHPSRSMKLSIPAVLATIFLWREALAVSTPLTPADTVRNIEVVTAFTQTLDDTLKGLTTSSKLAEVEMMGTTAVTHLSTIVNVLTEDIPGMKATPPFGTLLANREYPELMVLQFVITQQGLLNSQKQAPNIRAIRSPQPHCDCSAKIGGSLWCADGVNVQSFALTLANMVPCRSVVVFNILDTSLERTIIVFREPCLASPVYPLIYPICLSAHSSVR
ncbi:hypothetical protein B0H17DRAFT_1144331 [Mycena rosella]|uniref:Uncharacterized protein n=1 Tax=Mycena rosella TaxID=1033263 RepID=A0AAD7CTS0_MYCRO|nr:hypothetical protein B0H17DRAFT_1144331 [Mycena rosella]